MYGGSDRLENENSEDLYDLKISVPHLNAMIVRMQYCFL